MDALQKFPQISIYASAINDITVPYPTGAIEQLDPFARANRRMMKGRKKLILPEGYPIDLEEGGLQL